MLNRNTPITSKYCVWKSVLDIFYMTVEFINGLITFAIATVRAVSNKHEDQIRNITKSIKNKRAAIL